ncbi:MAG: cobalt-precorrin-5B (C(1))-methyltransferase CbiD [Prevotella sp.]
MILIFGGTTEGRKAVKALEEAGKTFYYSTKTGEQKVDLCHGIAVSGAMTQDKMRLFCMEHDIRLIVDAAHPFAAHLHATVAEVAASLNIPAIRFERIFPPRDNDIFWCDTYDEAIDLVSEDTTVLATTGVQSIAKLKQLEAKGCKVYYHILDRPSSLAIATSEGLKPEQLQEPQQADYMILKESGTTGGYVEKIKCARQKGMRIIALRRPTTPEYFNTVNGEHGLRRMVERLLPDFYPLHSGLTTGTYATAAAIAAYKMSTGGTGSVTTGSVGVSPAPCEESNLNPTTKRLALRQGAGETPTLPVPILHVTPTTTVPTTTIVPVILPNGETIHVEVHYADDYAYIIKESGDDPDVTNGAEIRAKVEPIDGELTIVGGEGVGHFTLPGFDYPPGEAAINRVPREMIRHNLNNAHVKVTISVVDGERLAQRTFNPRLGIKGGISIVGVSGIIKPFSEEAFVDSIRKCATVTAALGCGHIVISSGAKSERLVRQRFPTLPPQAFVEYGNYIGVTISIADELGIGNIHLVMMIGKAVKLAAGHLDTHSRRSTMDRQFVARMVEEAGCSADIVEKVSTITLAKELWTIIPEALHDSFVKVLTKYCNGVCSPLLTNSKLEIIILKEE